MVIVLDRLVYELYRMPNDLILSKPNFRLSVKGCSSICTLHTQITLTYILLPYL